MSGDGIDVGGTFGGGFTSADGACAEKCICTALDTGMNAIVDALTSIDNTLADKLDQGCKIVSECQQEIQDIIDATVAEALVPIEEAQGFLQQQIGENYVIIDGILTDINALQYEEGQSLNQPYILPQQSSKKTYYGWCDFLGGEALVTDSQVPPGPTFIQVAFGDEEDAVLAEATDTCKTYEPGQPKEPTVQPLTGHPATGDQCNVLTFVGADSFINTDIGDKTLFSVAGASEGLKAIADFGVEGINLGNLGSVINGIWNAYAKGPPVFVSKIVDAMGTTLGCSKAGWRKGIDVLTAVGMVEKFSGGNFSKFTTSIEYAMNAACPRIFIDPKDAIDSYLAKGIDQEQLAAHFAVHGLCPTEVAKMLTAAKAKREAEQLVMMRHRKVIDPDAFSDGMRQLGYLDDTWSEQIFAISEHLPDIATAIHVVQSGAISEDDSTRLGLSTGIEQLQQEPIVSWLRGNGISEETANYVYRTHWSTPNVGMLTAFYHRLRNDSDFNEGNKLEDEIINSLTSLGITPYWHQHILATLLQPLLKRDIRAAYTSGALKDDKLQQALELTGHDDDSVQVLIAELKPARRHAIIGHIAIKNWVQQQINGQECQQQLSKDGFDADTISTAMQDAEYELAHSTWCEAYARGALPQQDLISLLQQHGVTANGANTIADRLSYKIVDHQAIKNYTVGTDSRQSAMQDMQTYGMQSAIINRLLDATDDAINNTLALECIRGVKSQYLSGGVTSEEANSMLHGYGLTTDRINDYVSNFDCQRKADGKDVAVEKLCHWLYIGAIDQTDMYNRLLRLGYSSENAALLMVDCVNANTLKAVKQQQQQAKELQSQLDKERAAVNKVNAANQRQAERLAKMRSEQARLRGLRQKQYVSASEKVYKATNTDLSTALSVVRSAIDSVKQQYGLTEDETLKIAILASEEMKGQDVAAYQPLLEQLATAAASTELTPSLADIGVAPSSNGDTQPSGLI